MMRKAPIEYGSTTKLNPTLQKQATMYCSALLRTYCDLLRPPAHTRTMSLCEGDLKQPFKNSLVKLLSFVGRVTLAEREARSQPRHLLFLLAGLDQPLSENWMTQK